MLTCPNSNQEESKQAALSWVLVWQTKIRYVCLYGRIRGLVAWCVWTLNAICLGRLKFPHHPTTHFRASGATMRIAGDGHAWLGEGTTLSEISSDGRVAATIEVKVEPGEEMGSFLLTPDGFVVATHQPNGEKAKGRIIRLDGLGRELWAANMSVELVGYSGVEEIRADTGWQVQSKPAWQPEDWQPTWSGEPLILSGDRLLVRYFELRSGIGRLILPRLGQRPSPLDDQTSTRSQRGLGRAAWYPYRRSGIRGIRHVPLLPRRQRTPALD